MEKNVTDYDNEITTISLSLLLELMMVLKGYSNDMVLVGGWVPFFLLKKHNTDPSFQHVGSVDIDLVLDPELITQGRYDSIVEILIKNGYSPRKDRLGNIIEFSFEKTIQDRTIHVDFLSTIYPDRPERRHRIVQPDLQARTLKGARIVLTHFYLDKIDGTLPNKAEVEVECKIANLVGSLVTKAIAIGDRTDPKDYYDIYSLISYYKNGTSS
ncbi:MAG: nucleotidyl transferase AbiEii/AbiGii toxin family protein, partial [Candidatus Hodarchaeota archaeon]